MRFGQIGMMRPEQLPQPFNIYSQSITTSQYGRLRETTATTAKATGLRCILSTAKPEEVQRYSQTGVVVTHTIIARGTPNVKEQDVFVLAKGGVETRKFRVQAIHNKGALDIDTVFYCEERNDRK